ncbi:MAG: hypothetical protein HOP11_11390 [Saprospiraceae bacterium]|nr:hypothetical protein [Saprospiraceae bacterium]
MIYRAIIIFAFASLLSCSVNKKPEQKYLRWVGDIEHDSSVDGNDFKLCNTENDVRQYFNMYKGLQIEGEKKMILKHFIENYQPVKTKESGWIRVRFIVNCKGETGRFRMIESDENYQERTFDSKISKQIFQLTKSLQGWKPQKDDGKSVDYYQYLVFKISNGNIEKIMP